MRDISSIALLVGCMLAAVCGEVTAQDSRSESEEKPARIRVVPAEFDKAAAEKESRAAIQEFVKSFNTADNPTFRKAHHFPFVAFERTGRTAIYQKPEDYSFDFETLQQGRWDHSTFDKIEPISILPEKAQYKVAFSRRTKSGDAYVTGEIIYIASKREGRWAVCAKSLLGYRVRVKQ